MNWTISKRIGLTLTFVISMYIAVMFLFFGITARLRSDYDSMLNRTANEIVAIKDIKFLIHEQNGLVYKFLHKGEKKSLKDFTSSHTRMEELLESIRLTSLDPETLQELGTLRLMLAQRARTLNFIIILVKELGPQAAENYLEYGRFIQSVDKEIQRLIQLSNNQAKQIIAINLARSKQLQTVFLTVLVISITSVLLLTLRINSMVSKPLQEIVAASRGISNGKFDNAISTSSKDEFAEVGMAFNNMAKSLKPAFDNLMRLQRTEAALTESERRFRGIFEQSYQFIGLLNPEGTLLAANRNLLNFIGAEEQDVVGKLFWETPWCKGNPTDQQNLQEWLKSAAEGEFVRTEVAFRSKDNQLAFFDFSLKPVKDENENVVLIIPEARDISALKNAEFELASQKVFSDTIIHASPAFIVALSNSGSVMFMNDSMLAALGYTLDEVKNTEYLKTFVPQADWTHLLNLFESILTKHEKMRYESRLLTKDGVEIVVEWHTQPVMRNADVDFFVGVGIDITESKQTQAELLRIGTAISQIAEIVVITDTSGVVQYVNPAYTKVTGYTREEALGTKPDILKSGQHSQDFYSELWSTIARGETWRGHLVNKKKDGTLYDEDAAISPIRDTAGEITNYVAVKRDITRELSIENQLRQAQKMEAVGTLAGGIAHDFNNILGAIMGFTELSLDAAREHPKQYDNLRQVLIASERAKDLIRQILTISRKTETEVKALEISPILKEIARFMRASLPTSIDINLQLNAKKDVVVASPIEIHQVLMNLCTNAGQSMKEHGGLLELRTENISIPHDEVLTRMTLKEGIYVVLTVRDTGTGIPAEYLDRIFEPYFTTKPKGEGTGLGLAVAHGIITGYGGHISVQSELGEGTIFSVYLLVAETQDLSEEQKLLTTPGGTERILLVDDEPSLVAIAKELLSELGYKITGLSDSEEALAIFTNSPSDFDLIITDKTMPNVTGFDLARTIKEIRPELPVILCTGFADKDDSERLAQLGIEIVLMKPFKRHVLARAVRDLLDRSRSTGTPTYHAV